MLESTIQHIASESLIGVQLVWDVVTVKAIAYDLHNFHTHQTIQWASLSCI